MSKSCHVSIVLLRGGELLMTNYLVRQGACLGLLCELCATGGYSQVESSGVCGWFSRCFNNRLLVLPLEEADDKEGEKKHKHY